MPNRKNNYDIFKDSLTFDVPYDPKSLTHYKYCDHSNGNCPTLSSKVTIVYDVANYKIKNELR